MKFTGICLITNDVPALADFYSQLLGVTAEGDAQHMELHTDGAGIAIFTVQGMEDMAPGCMQGAGHGGCTLGFEVQDVDEEYARLQALGVEIVKLPQSYPWGTRSVWLRDPDGNIVDFYAVLNR
jgi:predicted enzyme related to lactoylglutathione lyase